MYELYTDKNENFECKISIEGSNLSKANARLVLESTEYNLIFEGKIDNTGKCIIPIKKLKLLSENLKGNLKLEVIVDNDTYFVPYTDTFIVKTNKKVTVEVTKPSEGTNKKVLVEVYNSSLVDEIYKKLKQSKINLFNVSTSKVAKVIIKESLSKHKGKLSSNSINKIKNDLVAKLAAEV